MLKLLAIAFKIHLQLSGYGVSNFIQLKTFTKTRFNDITF